MNSRRHFREGWLILVLLTAVFLTVVWSLQAAGWAKDLDLLNWVVLGGVLVGVLLAKSPLPGGVAHPLATLLGLGWITRLAFRFTPETLPWDQRAIMVWERVVRWLDAVVAGQAGGDQAIFVLQMALLMWLIVYTGTWYLFRAYSPWSALIPAGTTILINTYYAQASVTGFFLLFILFSYLLVARTNLLEREEEWRRASVIYPPDIVIDFLRDGTIFAVVVLALAWAVPSIVDGAWSNPTLAKLGRPWGEVQRTWTRLFGTLNYRGSGGTAVGGGWFGQSMTFRGPLNLSDEVIMYVYAPEGKGRYWRAAVFDTYTGAGWTTTNARVVTVDQEPARIPLIEDAGGREAVEMTFEMIRPAGALLFTPAQPVQVSMPVKVLLAGPAAESGPLAETPETAVTQIYARQPLVAGDRYTVVAAIPEVDERSLRQAGTNYPSYIVPHYTALPPTVPKEVIRLAEELTAGLETPYDKAKAIERYLRNIRYDENIPGPRPGEDGVYYFLFRELAGYCDYYAAAMAVMLRAVGIPARVAQGYAVGTYDPDAQVYEVRGVDAHTWVEVYFPGYGWIEFEPTAAEPPLDRPASLEENEGRQPGADRERAPRDPLDRLRDLQEAFEPPELPTRPALTRIQRPSVRVVAVPVGVVLGSAVALGLSVAVLRRRWRDFPFVEQVYDQLVLLGRLVGLRPSATQTPREYVRTLAQNVPGAREVLDRLGLLVSKARFARQRLTAEDEEEARRLWDQGRDKVVVWALRQVPRQWPHRARGAVSAWWKKRRQRRKKWNV